MSPELRTELLRGIFESASQRPYWEENVSIIGSVNIDSDAQAYESYFLFLLDLYDFVKEQYGSKTDIVATVLNEELEELDEIALPLFFWDGKEASQDATLNNITLLQQHINKLRNNFDVPVKNFMNAKLRDEKSDDQESVLSFATVTTLSTLQYSEQSSRSNSPFDFDEDVDYSNNSSAKSNSEMDFF